MKIQSKTNMTVRK